MTERKRKPGRPRLSPTGTAHLTASLLPEDRAELDRWAAAHGTRGDTATLRSVLAYVRGLRLAREARRKSRG